MDLNQVYSEHQVLLMNAERAATLGSRRVLEVAASHVAGRIGCMQRAMGASGARAWDALAITDAGSLAPPGRHQQGLGA